MPRYADNVFDDYRRPVLGAQIYVTRTEDRSIAELTDDDSLPLVQPLVTDRSGLFAFNAADGLYDLEVRYAGRLRHREGSVLVGVHPCCGDVVTPASSFLLLEDGGLLLLEDETPLALES